MMQRDLQHLLRSLRKQSLNFQFINKNFVVIKDVWRNTGCVFPYVFFYVTFSGLQEKVMEKNGKNATKTGAEILPWAVKCPYMAEKI